MNVNRKNKTLPEATSDVSGSYFDPDRYRVSSKKNWSESPKEKSGETVESSDTDTDKTISEDELEFIIDKKVATDKAKLKSPAVFSTGDKSEPSAKANTRRRDLDDAVSKSSGAMDSDAIPMCTYGSRCYRKNPDHLKRFRHPQQKRLQGEDRSSQPNVSASKNVACSPEPKRTKLSCNGGLESRFYFTKVRGIPDSFNNGIALSIKDILSPKNGNLQASAQFNYMFEFPWFMEQYPAEFRNKPLLVVHGEQRMAKDALTKRASAFPNVTLCQAPLEIMYGTHHSKMMFLLYDDGLRIVIHTANLVRQDWDQKTQGIWVGPIFPKLDGPPSVLKGDSPTQFKRDLLDYLSSYKASGLNEWCNHIKAHDMSSAQVHIISSVPGRHTGERKTMFGHLKLRKVLRDSGPDTSRIDKTWPVIGQFSSIGSLGSGCSQWLSNEWQSSLSATKGCGIPVRSQQLKLIFPCVDNVRVSLEGYPAGASLPYSKQVSQKQPWLRDFLHVWKSTAHGRGTASPHIKTYLRTSPDSTKIAWMLLTSANLSKAAWGAHEKSETQLAIRSYEIGVLFLPSYFGVSDFEAFKGGFTVPFDLPLIRYGTNDQPWVWDAPHTELPDRYGNMWQPS